MSLATLEEKLYTISKLAFPKTLSMLETYLGITGWLRDYIPRYTEILKLLMKRKTVLLVRSPPSEQQRYDYTKKTLFETPSNEELLSF